MLDDAHLARNWIEAAARPEVRAGLEAVYAAAASAIADRGPACWASGRCCNFEKTGHLLYVTGLEAAYTVVNSRDRHAALSLPVLKGPGCPFQSGNLCGVHEIKPLGCRVYFCDRSAQQWQNDLNERLLAEVRAIHDRHGVEYRYGEWRAMLAAFAA
ncbi:MAG: YkgJ family cysteine cluster protein [Phycisphaeraceae bacterium]|nr:YkgJ family cysteine cluster protein [Phycisphaeraceae bacterium]